MCSGVSLSVPGTHDGTNCVVLWAVSAVLTSENVLVLSDPCSPSLLLSRIEQNILGELFSSCCEMLHRVEGLWS
jgi:hypothetical protein